MVANLPYSVATPLILRTIEQLPSLATLDGDGPARDRRPAAGGARQPHLRLARAWSPSSPARSSWCARSTPPSSSRGRGSTRRSCACAAPGPAPTRPTRAPRPRRLRPPPQVPGPLARARRAGLARPGPGGAGRAGPGRGRPRRGALARASSPPCPRSCRATPDAVRRRDAPPRPRQAQPLPLPRPPPRRRPARALLAVRAAGAGRPDRRSPRPSATR